MKESDFTKQLMDQLTLNKYYCFKHVAHAYGYVGIPDIIACKNGRFIGLEVKLVVGKTLAYTETQRRNLEMIRGAGGLGLGIAVNPLLPTAVRWSVDQNTTGKTASLMWGGLPEVLKELDSLLG